MTGFIDRNTRIVDMVLTNYGKRKLSNGDLRFCYWIPYDDEIDYDPYVSQNFSGTFTLSGSKPGLSGFTIISSGTLTSEQLSASIDSLIESTPIREATTGYRNFNRSGSDFTNVHRPMFTMSQGQNILPRANFPITGSREVQAFQRGVYKRYDSFDEQKMLGIERFNSSKFELDFSYKKDAFKDKTSLEGFFIQIFSNESSGWYRLLPRRDSNNNITYNNDINMFVDGES